MGGRRWPEPPARARPAAGSRHPAPTVTGVLPDFNVLGLSVKTFGLCLGVAFLLVGVVFAKQLREAGKPVDWAYEAVFAALVGGIVGSRLWWVVQNWGSTDGNLLGNLFGGAGLVFYGGLIGGALGVLLWAWRKGELNLAMLDMCAPGVALGYAAGRIGCQISGDGDYGTPWDGPWAMAYPKGTVPTDVPVHPTPIYETVVMGFVVLLLFHLRHRLAPGRLLALYLILGGVERFFIEFLRRNPDDVLGLTLAQVISIGMVAAGAAWWTYTRGRPARPVLA